MTGYEFNEFIIIHNLYLAANQATHTDFRNPRFNRIPHPVMGPNMHANLSADLRGQ